MPYDLPDISKGTDGKMTATCLKCGNTKEFVLSCPVITLSKTKYTYSCKAFKPTVKMTVDGEKIPAKLDGNTIYTVKYLNNKNVGKASVKVSMVDGSVAVGTKTLKFTIVKAKNPMTVKANAKSVSLKTVKKINVTVKNAITVKKNQGSVSYAKVSKGSFKYMTISKKGVITFKKWKTAKKGTYKIIVNVTAKGNSNYNKITKKVTVNIKIK